MPSTPIPTSSPTFPNTSATTANGVTHIDLNFATAMSKGTGSIFITDGTIQTVIDRATGQPKLRVVGATFTKEIAVDQVHVSGTHVLFDVAGLPAGHSWNVYMGAGTLLGGGKPIGAITVPGSATFTTPDVVVEPPPPTLTASIALDGSSLKSGQQIGVTITFNKAVDSLGAASFAIGNATLGELTKVGDGHTWTAKLVAEPGKDAAGNVLRLNMDTLTATDGSRGAGVVSSTSYAVDTIVEAYVYHEFGILDDEGPDDMDGITNDDSMGVGGLLFGTLKDGEHIELVINGRTIPSAQIQFYEWDGPNVSYWYYDNDDEHFNPGNNTIEVRVVGAGGHSSPGTSKTVVIDTDAPGIASAPTDPVDAGGSISITFDEKMGFAYSEGTEYLEVVDSFGNTSWIEVDSGNLSADGKTLTLTAAEHKLATGNSYTFHLPYNFTDLAGNEYEGEPIRIETSGPYQDKAPPRLVQAYVETDRELYAKGDTLALHMRFSEKVSLDADTAAAFVLELTNGGEATYSGMSADGKEIIFTYTVRAGEDQSWVDIRNRWDLSGHVRDEVGNVMDDVHIEFDSLTTESGYGVSIDTYIAKPGAPRLHADSDTGEVGDRITTDTTPHLTGTGAEAHATVTLYAGDLEVGHTTADDEGHWDITVSTPLASGNHSLVVVQKDQAGNVSTVSDALVLTISAAPDSGLGTPHLPVSSDTGVSNSDGITSDNTPELRGTGPASTTLKLLHDGVEMTEVTTDASGVWSFTLPELAEGVHTFGVRQGASGPVSATLSITVDRTRPTVVASPDGAANLNPDGSLVITFSEAVNIAAAEGDSGKLILRDDNDNLIRIAREAISFSADKKTLTIAADQHNMAANTEYHLTLPSTLTDLAGNPMAEYEIEFRTGNDLLPTVSRTTVVGAHGGTYINAESYRAGDVITFRIRFNESIQRVGSDELSLGLSNGARASFTGIGGSGDNEAIFTYTVGAGEDQSGVTIVDSTLAGKLADLSGNVLDAAHIVFGGMRDGSGYGTHIDIDTVAPAKPGLPALTPDSNSGSKDDLVTSDRTPTLGGIGAEAGARIEIYEGDTLLGWTYAYGDGIWNATVDAGHALTAGVHNLTIRQLDAPGNRSVASDVLALTIDFDALAPSAPLLATASDSGTVGDGITNDSSPTLSGTAEAYAHVEIFRGTTLLGTAEADASGVWSTTIGLVTALADNVHSLTVIQTDRAGNVSPASSALTLTVDTAASAPAAPLLDSTSDSGTVGDGLTSDATPTLSGTAEAGASIEIYEGAALRGAATANASGLWNTTLATLADGLHNLTVKQTDRAGNVSAASSALALTIDTTAPAALAVPGLADDTGLSATDRVTKETEPVLRGSGAEAHANIEIMRGDVRVGNGMADENGDWQAYFDTPLAEGTHTFTVFQLDRAGNAGADSAEFTVTVDTTLPNPPNTPVLDSGSDSGTLGDGLTNDRTPTLRGTADANIQVVLYVNGSEAGRASTNASGNWSFTLDDGHGLADGLYGVQLKQFDLAGNLSGFSDGFDLTIDGSAPAAPGTPQLATASDTGASNSDGLTRDTTPTLYGGGAEAGATIVLYSGESEITRVVADPSGNWEYTFPDANALTDGNYAFSVKQIDKAGNASAVSTGLAIVIDSTAPALTAFYNDRTLKQFELSFSEAVRFDAAGKFTVLRHDNVRREYFGSDDSNWHMVIGTDGKPKLVLEVGMNGTFNLTLNNESAIHDDAGNIAVIVGSPFWAPDQTI